MRVVWEEVCGDFVYIKIGQDHRQLQEKQEVKHQIGHVDFKQYDQENNGDINKWGAFGSRNWSVTGQLETQT